MKITLIGVLLCISNLIFAQKTQKVRIEILEKSTNQTIESATVKIPKYSLTTTTDPQGIATFENVPIGRFEVEISSVGYVSTIVKELLLESSRSLSISIQLDRKLNSLKELQITAATKIESGALTDVYAITTEQIFRFPATFFDPARLAMSMPGVANNNDQANGMSIRGNTPQGIQWRLEGVEIVNPNHLSNAGTFSDKPTETGGGTNILSAQMLGNMNILTGTFPAGYGNALSGVMDMRFRVGDNEKHEHIVQAGLIGLDIASEGPINKKKGSSYLINYRYSFTGLLGKMGIDFGGESINFQDLAFNFNFPTKKLGTFNIFGMGGNSNNVFKPNEDATLWESQKDLTNIDFHGRMGVIGLKHTLNINNKSSLKTTLANSGLENLRSIYSKTQAVNSDYDYQARNIVSFASNLTGKVKNQNVSVGVTASQYYNEFNIINSQTRFYSYSEVIVQPNVKVFSSAAKKLSYNIGIQAPYYSGSKSFYIEPRAAIAYQTSEKTQINLSYGLHSQQLNSRFIFDYAITPIRSHQFGLGANYNLNTEGELSAKVFYQSLFNGIGFSNQYISLLNGTDGLGYSDQTLTQSSSKQGRNYGLELNYKKYLSKGTFALINTTLYKSEFKAFDNKFYETRFSGNHIVNLTLGKEWEKTSGKIIGLNTRIAWIGGFRNYEIKLAESKAQNTTVYDYSKPLTNKNPDFFRPDLRVYFKKSKTKTTRTWSLDIQNVANYKNTAYQYYDAFLDKVVIKNQLGMIPMINYRIEF